MESKSEIKIELEHSENAQTLAAAAALGCFEEKSSDMILRELKKLPEEERKKKERVVIKNSFGRGHGSVGDQTFFLFSIENLPRIATLQLCLPEYLAHLQQSLRRAQANRGIYLPESIKNSSLGRKAKELAEKTFDFYKRAQEGGIPAEDARFLLTLYTKTNISTIGNVRELCHLKWMSNRPGTPKVVTETVDAMVNKALKQAPDMFENFGFNYEPLSWYPSSQLLAETNKTIKSLIAERGKEEVTFLGHMSSFNVTAEMLEKAVGEKDEAELSNLKHVHFEFLVSMSLACFHQATRQRTWNQSVESLYEAAKSALENPEERIVIPPSIKNSDFCSEYKELHQSLMLFYRELVDSGIPKEDAIGMVPHSLKVYDLIHINGWNAIHSIGKRTCVEAQWEIRLKAREMAKHIKAIVPAFEKWAEPQCITYGKCPEIRDCGYYKTKK